MSAGPLRAAIGLSLRADRRATLLTFVSFGLRPTVPVLIFYLVKLLVDAAVAGQGRAVAVLVGAIALAAGVAVGTIPYAIELSVRMVESTAAAVDELLMKLVGGLPWVSHLEDPELLDRIEVLRQERVHLAEGGDSFSLVLGASIRAVFTAVVLALVHPLLLLLPVLAIPSVLAARRGQRRRTDAVQRTAGAARLARHFYGIGSTPDAGKELRLFGLGPHLRQRFAATAADADREVTATVWRSLALNGCCVLVFAAGYFGALVLTLHDYAGGGASLGDVVLTLSLVSSVSSQLSQGINLFGFLQQTTAACRRLLWLRDYAARAAAEAPGGAEPAPRLRDGIRLEGVGFRYPGSEKRVLDGVDLHLPAGSVIAVVGVNGAGKSTLIKLLSGLYPPEVGRITVDGVDLAELSASAWRLHTSACFQDFGRLEFTVRHSVGVGDLSSVDDETAVSAAIEQGAATEVVAGLPHGADTPLGRSFPDGTELSGGQWQRVALARSRMRAAPCLLVLDEPTAAIDPLAEETVLRAYVRAARETVARANGITLFASHRLAVARLADLIVVVDGGSIVQMGPHTELLDRPDGIYRELYRKQAGAYA